MRFKTKYIMNLMAILLVSSFIVSVFAGTGSLRIDPPLPYMNESPAEFDIWVQGVDTAYEPIILLVMTDSCMDGLSEDPMVKWNDGADSVTLDSWTEETTNGVKVPPGASNGAAYTVASLKDHLDTSESIHWATALILDGPIVPGETYKITVYMESDDPRMLVYVLGKSEGSSKYDMSVPPTIPGFVVPEVPIGTILALVTMVGAAAIYKYKKDPQLSF
jgi:hypothetical protein